MSMHNITKCGKNGHQCNMPDMSMAYSLASVYNENQMFYNLH